MKETEFSLYLAKKKIDPVHFQKIDPEQFKSFNELFNQVHENSFTAQKLFLLNGIRRKHPYSKKAEINAKPAIQKMKPKMKIKPKL